MHSRVRYMTTHINHQFNRYLHTKTIIRFLLRALQQFCDTSVDQQPPLGGSIPDMVSTTGFFVGLQKVYQQKAAADRLLFQKLLANIILVRHSTFTLHFYRAYFHFSQCDNSSVSYYLFCTRMMNHCSVSAAYSLMILSNNPPCFLILWSRTVPGCLFHIRTRR